MTESIAPSKPARVSVALCTFNGERFLAQQLRSIIDQTRPVDEIIICDDGSTDQTSQIASELAQSTKIPVHFSVNPTRLGVTRNFDQAASRCTGDVILLSDQDDLWHPNKVERLLHCFDDSNVGLAFSNAQVVREDLSQAGYRLWDSVWFNTHEVQRVSEGYAMPVLLRHAIAAGSTLAFRSSFRPVIFPIPDFPHSHDIWITLIIAGLARIQPVNEDLVQYRLHQANHVGLRNYGFFGQIKMARQQLRTNAFQYAADLHQAAKDRLQQQSIWPVSPATIQLLDEKIRHSKLRHEMPARWLSRLPIIQQELRNGNYSKYSYGFKSVLQDLYLR